MIACYFSSWVPAFQPFAPGTSSALNTMSPQLDVDVDVEVGVCKYRIIRANQGLLTCVYMAASTCCAPKFVHPEPRLQRTGRKRKLKHTTSRNIGLSRRKSAAILRGVAERRAGENPKLEGHHGKEGRTKAELDAPL